MGVTTTKTNKPFNPRGNDQSPLAYNRAKLYSGKALDFDGVNDLITIGSPMMYNTHTFAALVNRDIIGIDSTIFDNRDGDNDGVRVLLTNGGNLYYQLNDSDVYLAFNPANEWNFLVFTYDGTTARIYNNGHEIKSQSVSQTFSVSTNLNIGKSTYENLYFDGKMAGFKIFNTALTAAQVADLYNNPEKVVPTGVDNTALKLWLPMMEGAGTTAYDGSGNGNHGTISGATYVNGVGAPVSQSAVISWNKGVNKLADSSDLENATRWTLSTGITIEAGYTAPDGTNTAFKVTGTNNLADASVTEENDYRAIWARTTSGTGTAQLLSHNSNTNNIFNITEEWQKFSVDSSNSTGAANFYAVDFRGSGTLNEVVLWQPHCADSESVLVPTIGTAQTTPVLLPQGLTSGRDITGVNLFENVRKQGALNLDGNSWAEVHDNASLDITSAITLEAWVYWDGSISDKGILGRYVSATPGPLLYVNGSTSLLYFAATNININYTSMTTGWRHIVGTYNKVNSKLYVDGVLVNTGSQTDDINLSANPFAIGRYNNEISKSYPNDIAQPRIYNRALTAEEVQRNYNAGKNTYTN